MNTPTRRTKATSTAAGNLLPEVVRSTRELTKTLARELAKGRVRRIGPRLYTTNMTDPAETVVRRNLWILLGQMIPGAVVGYRTALEGTPTETGLVFLTGRYGRTIRLPGHTVNIVPGPGPLEGDNQFVGGLYLASRERALLESVAAWRRRSGSVRGISDEALQERLERQLKIGGEAALNALRDKTRPLAVLLKATEANNRINDIIGTLLGTRKAAVTSPLVVARIAGRPYDSARLPLFGSLLAQLRERPGVNRSDSSDDADAWRHSSFFDAYFSNYIEGTEFELGEALQIVFESKIPLTRPKDAHDVLGVFRLLVDRRALARTVVSLDADAFEQLLKERHAAMLQERPEVRPGQFKEKPNRAGETFFVAPELVRGTLDRGLEMMRALDDPFARAAFVMFLISEVHPFDDGNGRIARMFMNAELAAAKQSRILVPIVFRDDYLLALRSLSRQGKPVAFVGMLDRAQRFTSEVDFTVLPRAVEVLTACSAFREPGEAVLRLPSELNRGGQTIT